MTNPTRNVTQKIAIVSAGETEIPAVSTSGGNRITVDEQTRRPEKTEHDIAYLTKELENTQNQYEVSIREVIRLTREYDKARTRVAEQADEIERLKQDIRVITATKGWRLAEKIRIPYRYVLRFRAFIRLGPERVLYTVGRYSNRLYRRLPIPHKTKALLKSRFLDPAGDFFRRLQTDTTIVEQHKTNHEPVSGAGAIVFNKTECAAQPGRIAVFVHLYYVDLLSEIIAILKNIPYRFDLLVSTANESSARKAKKHLGACFPNTNVIVKVAPNRGRNIAPLVVSFADEIPTYEYLCHIHTKKSIAAQGGTAGWRQYLFQSLLGSRKLVRQIFGLFIDNPDLGIIFPRTYHKLPYWANHWLSNKPAAASFALRLGIDRLPDRFFSFPAGSMFWARTAALRPLFDSRLSIDDFPVESGQLDGTLAHAIERFFSVVPLNKGYTYAVTEYTAAVDELSVMPKEGEIDFSPYLSNSLTSLKNTALLTKRPAISFDIFDTLLMRPLLEPSDLFDLMEPEVVRRTGKEISFKEIRLRAEALCRARCADNRDVTLDDIYDELRGYLGQYTHEIKQLELESERKYLLPRRDVITVFNRIADLKKTLLLSDMYLPEKFITDILTEKGLLPPTSTYISSSVGLRKDTRQLYPYVLENEKLEKSDLLHVGDNAHSDIQVTSDIGITSYHVLKPTDLLQISGVGSRVFADNYRTDHLIHRLIVGLISAKLFENPFPKNGFPRSICGGNPYLFGYCYFGPFTLLFTNWVIRRSGQDNIDSLYFIMREGDVLHRAFEIFRDYLPDIPDSTKLWISRRSITVPALREMEDIYGILRDNFFGGSLQELFYSRFGVDLNEVPGRLLTRSGFASPNDPVWIPRDLNRLTLLVNELKDEILQQGRDEREHLLAYLGQEGFSKGKRIGIVDLGYSGTVQHHLINFLGCPIHGYYGVTTQQARKITYRHDSIVRGMLAEFINPIRNDITLFKDSLFYEMVYSSGTGGVEHYHPAGGARVIPISRKVVGEDKKLVLLPLIHQGITDFVRDYLSLFGETLIGGNGFDPKAIQRPFKDFLDNPVRPDIAMLAGMTLDDYYCGNGLLYWVPEIVNNAYRRDQIGKVVWKQAIPLLKSGV